MAKLTSTPVAVDLYWILPGPLDFVRRIACAATECQMLFVNMPRKTVPGTWEAILQGLHDAHMEEVREIRVSAGNDLSADIGANLGLDRISPESLAGHIATRRTAFMLRPDATEKAGNNAEQFAAAFMQANPSTKGNILLVVGISNDDLAEDGEVDGMRIVTFDGGLSADEMEAYVSLRMMDRPGPGSTRLLRSIVAEFAGFDVELAEELLTMDEAQLMAIQEYLPELASQQPDRGRTSRWAERTISLSQPGATHIFHDFYLSRHGSAIQKSFAAGRITSRYWRAAVKTITPWLEERRWRVLGFLEGEIKRIQSENNGTIPRVTQTRTDTLSYEDLEYNNIVGMANNGILIAKSKNERAAVEVCRSVKRVRDDIAHMRAPSSNAVGDMIRQMDALLKSGNVP